MLADPTGGGNPNFFKTFKGAFSHAPSPEAMFTSDRVMLSCVNDVQFQGDCMIMNYTPGATLTILPPECRPSTEVRVPVVVDTRLDVLAVQTNGVVSLNASTDRMAYMAGLSFNADIQAEKGHFNISMNWYSN